MDPVTAVCTTITALCNLAETLVKSQPVDVQAAIWKRIDDHVTWLRSVVHLPPT